MRLVRASIVSVALQVGRDPLVELVLLVGGSELLRDRRPLGEADVLVDLSSKSANADRSQSLLQLPVPRLFVDALSRELGSK